MYDQSIDLFCRNLYGSLQVDNKDFAKIGGYARLIELPQIKESFGPPKLQITINYRDGCRDLFQKEVTLD